MKLVMAGGAVAVAAILSACSGNGAADNASPVQGAGDAAAVHASSQGAAGSAALRFPNTRQIVQFTGYDTTVNMAQFQLVTWQAGGADNGHFEPVPGDTKIYRLPLRENAQVFSAYALCPSGSITVDDMGFGNQPCTPERLMRALTSEAPPFAEIQVDGNDSIAVVKEMYTP